MMFQCPYCKCHNGVSAHDLMLGDFCCHKIACAKCDREFFVQKIVAYQVLPPKEEIKQ